MCVCVFVGVCGSETLPCCSLNILYVSYRQHEKKNECRKTCTVSNLALIFIPWLPLYCSYSPPPFFFFLCGDSFRPPLVHFHHLHPGMVCAHLLFIYARGETGGSGMQWKSLWGNIRESVISWHSRSLPAGCLLKTGMVVLEETAVTDVQGPRTQPSYLCV